MQQLKEGGIYALPSERGELVAHAVFRGGYVLYTPRDWEFFGPYTYESDAAGNIRREEQSTPWHIDDLAYTNRTARSRRSEEHTSELQSPYVISYAVFCL